MEDVAVLADDALGLGQRFGAGHVPVADFGRHDLAGVVHTGQHVEARVGDFDHAEVHFGGGTAGAGGVGVAAGEGVEDGGFAGLR